MSTLPPDIQHPIFLSSEVNLVTNLNDNNIEIFSRINQLRWEVQVEALHDGTPVLTTNDCHVSIIHEKGSFHFSPIVKISITSLTPLSCNALEILIIIKAHLPSSVDDINSDISISPIFVWTCHLNEDNHYYGPYDKDNDVCSMKMDCDGLQAAISNYTYFPRMWTGAVVSATFWSIMETIAYFEKHKLIKKKS